MADPLVVDASQVHSLTVDPSQVSIAKPESATSRFMTGTGITSAFSHPLQTARRGLGIITPGDIKAAWDTVSSIADTSSEHFKTALKASAEGDYAKATEHALYAVPVLGEQGRKIAEDFKTGNIAGGLGGVASVVLPMVVGAGGAKLGQAAEAGAAKLGQVAEEASGALADSKAGTFARGAAAAAKPTLEDIPVIGKTIKPFVKAYQGGMKAVAEAEGNGQANYTAPSAAGRGGVLEVPASAVRPLEYGEGSGHFGEQPPAAAPPPSSAPRVPMWEAKSPAVTPDPARAPAAPELTADEIKARVAEIQAQKIANRTPVQAPPTREPRVAIWQQGEQAQPTPLGSSLNPTPNSAEMAVARERYQAIRDRNAQTAIDKIKALGRGSGRPVPDTAMVATEPEAPPAQPQSLGQVLEDDTADEHAARQANRGEEKHMGNRAALVDQFREHMTKNGIEPTDNGIARAEADLGKKMSTADTRDVLREKMGFSGDPSDLEADLQKSLDALKNRRKGPISLGEISKQVDARKVTPDEIRAGSPGTRAEIRTAEKTAAPGNQPISAPSSNEFGAGHQTDVYIPGESRTYPARYKLRELADLQPSHNGLTFQPNPAYELTNDRDYTKIENQGKIVEGALPAKFRPGLLITDNPDASNGPPLVDARGNVAGGNSRSMMLQRVYGSPNAAAAEPYRGMLKDKAAQYGIDPAHVDAMKEPVLTRELSEQLGKDAAQNAVTDFNKTGTAALTPSERIISDSKRISPATLEGISRNMDAIGPSATMAEVLRGPTGLTTFQQLVRDGVITPQETAAYVKNGNLTAEGQARIGKVLLGRFFRDPSQIDSISSVMRSKIERMAAPLVKAETNPGWALTPIVQEALDLIEETEAHGFKNIDMTLKQQIMGTPKTWKPEAIEAARILKTGKVGELVAAAREYADRAARAAEESVNGPGLFGPAETSTPAEAFADTFGALRKGRK